MNDVLLSVSISHVWNSVREVRENIGLRLEGQSLELRVAAMMAGAELLENAIKYGEAVPKAPDISLDLRLTENGIRLTTVNGCRDHASIARLETILSRIAQAKDTASLYLNVIERMADRLEMNPSGGLGLYRIAGEGRFVLSCDWQDDVVRVLASRELR